MLLIFQSRGRAVDSNMQNPRSHKGSMSRADWTKIFCLCTLSATRGWRGGMGGEQGATRGEASFVKLSTECGHVQTDSLSEKCDG